MLLILIFLLLLLWFFTNEELEGVDEGVDGADEGGADEGDILEEGLTIEEMNAQLRGTPSQPGSEVLISEHRVKILEILSDRQTDQLNDINTMISTIKTQELANKPDKRPL